MKKRAAAWCMAVLMAAVAPEHALAEAAGIIAVSVAADSTVTEEMPDGTIPEGISEGILPGELSDGTIPEGISEGILSGELSDDTMPEEMQSGILPEDSIIEEDTQETEYIPDGIPEPETESSEFQKSEFLISAEVVETKDYALPDAQAWQEDELDTEVVQLAPAGSAEWAQLPTYALFSNAEYIDSYGGQLDGDAMSVYSLMAEHYAQDQGIAEFSYTFEEPMVFHLDMTMEQFADKEYRDKNESYLDAKRQAVYPMQAAYDAFLFDYPQVFWIAPPKVSISSLKKENPAGGIDWTIQTFTFLADENFEGALALIPQFESAAAEAVGTIRSSLPESADRRQTVKAIHDYVCETAVYDYNYSSYAKDSKEYRMIHSAAGFFTDSNRKVVCDGYAKAFKILCDRFGIPCAVIPGRTTEGHAWNYVKMEDGNWYLVDTTWDDKTPLVWTYFLLGNLSKGTRGVTMEEERQAYTNFSSAKYTKTFAVPLLADVRHHSHEYERVLKTEATCMADRVWEYRCLTEECPDSYDETENGSVVGHQFIDYTGNQDATCLADGTKTAFCVYGCGAKDTVQDEGSRIPHGFTDYTSDGNATCLADGTKTASCVHGCGAKDTVQDEGSRIPHEFTDYISDGNASWYQDGTKTAFCVYGCGVKDTVQDEGSAKFPSVTLSETSMKLQRRQSADPVQVSGLAEGDFVSAWKTSDPSIVKVSSSGKIKAQNKTGKARVTVVLDSGLEKSIDVSVQKKPVKVTAISGIPKKIKLAAGKKFRLRPVLAPVTSLEKAVFTSSNKSVAQVNAKGVIRAKKKGKAVITVKAGRISVKCKVTVR